VFDEINEKLGIERVNNSNDEELILFEVLEKMEGR